MVFIEDEKTWDFSEGIFFHNIIAARFDTDKNKLAICEMVNLPKKMKKQDTYFRKIEKNFDPEKYSKSYCSEKTRKNIALLFIKIFFKAQ